MDKAKQDAYVDGWQNALESIMSTIENSIRDIVNNFELPEEYKDKQTGKLIVPEEKKIVIP